MNRSSVNGSATARAQSRGETDFTLAYPWTPELDEDDVVPGVDELVLDLLHRDPELEEELPDLLVDQDVERERIHDFAGKADDHLLDARPDGLDDARRDPRLRLGAEG